MSINAAVQHNLLYAKNIQPNYKAIIRTYWGECLDEVGGEFKKDVSVQNYENIITHLKDKMNKKFGEAFSNESDHGSMFRISHAQKSISVFVKHLWCLGKVPEPNICPVDRIVLNQTAAKLSNDIAWGYVNSIEIHRKKFKYITDAAAIEGLPVARWELFKFIE
jgi:hypothetical protein